MKKCYVCKKRKWPWLSQCNKCGNRLFYPDVPLVQQLREDETFEEAHEEMLEILLCRDPVCNKHHG